MIIVADSHERVLGEQFWKQFFQTLSDGENEERIIIGLSGGSSFDIFYRELSENFHKIPIKIREKIYFAFLDERIVEIDHIERNEKQLRDKFLGKLLEKKLLEESQILSVDISKKDIAGAYSKQVPHIHIGLFGVGPDGHIASLFPHHSLLQSEAYGYLEIKDSPKPPPHRITASPRMIHRIEHGFIAFMKGKEVPLQQFLDETSRVTESPVLLLREMQSLMVLTNIDNY